MKEDKNLKGNDRIEKALAAMYEDMCDERLCEVLSVIRQRKNEGGHFVVAVDETMAMRTITLADKTVWFAAFTCVEQELMKNEKVISGFTAEISSIFTMAMNNEKIAGVILNPWKDPLKIDKTIMELL